MSDDTAAPPAGHPPEPPPKPPTLSPGNLFAACILAVPLIVNMWLNADANNGYDGDYVTYGLVLGICLVLGVDISKIFRRRGD